MWRKAVEALTWIAILYSIGAKIYVHTDSGPSGLHWSAVLAMAWAFCSFTGYWAYRLGRCFLGCNDEASHEEDCNKS